MPEHPAAACEQIVQVDLCGFVGKTFRYPLRWEEDPTGLLAMLPISVVGVWNAQDNIPTLQDTIGTTGHLYRVTTAGSTSIDGIASWSIGDLIVFDGSFWRKITPVPVDLTGATATAKVRKNSTTGEIMQSLSIGSGIVITDASAGDFEIIMLHDDTPIATKGIRSIDIEWAFGTDTILFPLVLSIDVKPVGTE